MCEFVKYRTRQSSASLLDCVFIAPQFFKQRGAHKRRLGDSEGSLQEALSVPFKPVQHRGIVGCRLSDRPVPCVTQRVCLLFCPDLQKGLGCFNLIKIPDPVEDIPVHGMGVGLGAFQPKPFFRASCQGSTSWGTGTPRAFANKNILILQEEDKSVKKKSKHKKSKEKEESKEEKEKKKKKKKSKDKSSEIDELEAFLGGGGASMSKPQGGGDYEEL